MTLTLTTDQILTVYSGRPGCCCGCRGKHVANPKYRKQADAERGYAYDDNECNAGTVTRVLNTIKRLAESGEAAIDTTREYVAATTDTRVWIAYLR